LAGAAAAAEPADELDDETAQAIEDQSDDPEVAMQKKDTSGVLRKCLTKLSAEHREMMDLAILIREIASRGDAERALCREVLESVLRFSDSRGDTSFLSL